MLWDEITEIQRATDVTSDSYLLDTDYTDTIVTFKTSPYHGILVV
jgi:hypothetical protein